MATLVGVVFDKVTLQILRVIIPHDDGDLARRIHVGPKEDIAISTIVLGTSDDRAREMVRQKTGREPPI